MPFYLPVCIEGSGAIMTPILAIILLKRERIGVASLANGPGVGNEKINTKTIFVGFRFYSRACLERVNEGPLQLMASISTGIPDLIDLKV